MFETSSQWSLVEPLLCDLCAGRATWFHPLGALRCDDCPRPESDTLEGLIPPRDPLCEPHRPGG